MHGVQCCTPMVRQVETDMHGVQCCTPMVRRAITQFGCADIAISRLTFSIDANPFQVTKSRRNKVRSRDRVKRREGEEEEEEQEEEGRVEKVEDE